ncbi:hypothetical protein LissoIVSPER_00047 [Lissonota sp. PSUC_FEM 10030012]|nr:hypothetical protein [Lissonota sp. PSUC_FEM 10030012]
MVGGESTREQRTCNNLQTYETFELVMLKLDTTFDES